MLTNHKPTNQHSDILTWLILKGFSYFVYFWQEETKIEMPSERGKKLPILLCKKTTRRGRGSKIADLYKRVIDCKRGVNDGWAEWAIAQPTLGS